MKTAVYPGTFDPVTFGHFDIVKRASSLCDRLIIGVAIHTGKNSLFSVEERVDLVKEEITPLLEKTKCKIEVKPISGLSIDFARQEKAKIIIRGLRAVSDFEYELKLCVMNSRLAPEIETVFLMASERHQFVSSAFVKEIGRLNGDISTFVSPHVAQYLLEKFQNDESEKLME